MFVSVNHGTVRQPAVAVDYAPAPHHATFGMDGQAVRGVGEAAVVISRNDGRLDRGRGQPGSQFLGEVGVDAGLEEIAGDHYPPNGVDQKHLAERRQDQRQVGRRHGLAVAAAGVVVAEVQVRQHGRRSR